MTGKDRTRLGDRWVHLGLSWREIVQGGHHQFKALCGIFGPDRQILEAVAGMRCRLLRVFKGGLKIGHLSRQNGHSRTDAIFQVGETRQPSCKDETVKPGAQSACDEQNISDKVHRFLSIQDKFSHKQAVGLALSDNHHDTSKKVQPDFE